MAPALCPIEAAAGAEYTALAPAFSALARPPAFLFGPMPGYLARDIFGEFGVGGVGLYRLAEARVTFDGVVIQGGVGLWSLALNHPDYLVARVLAADGGRRMALPARHVPGPAALLHGPGYNVFGHWLVDFLPRLFVLSQAGFDIAALRYILPADAPGFASTFLRLIGVPADNIVVHDHRTEVMAPDALLIPTILRRQSRLSPLFAAATAYWADRVAASHAVLSEEGRRLFVTRGAAAPNRHLGNRARIEAIAAEAGYEIVQPETLPLPAQIALFRGARRIVGEYGSGLHGAMFARPGAAVCALRGTSHHPGFVQSAIADVCGHHCGYVFGPTPEHAADQIFTIDEPDFRRALEAAALLAP